MKRSILFFLFIIISHVSILSQGYVINSYDVEVDIESNGLVHVTERINVSFSEKRRGIIRDIPLRYKNAESSEGNAIIIDNIQVKDDPFVLIDDANFERIRIGSANKFLEGDKSYEISYDVLGAVEQFDGMAELVWNVIGDQWDTKIMKSSVRYTFPFPIVNPEEDILISVSKNSRSFKELDRSKVGLDKKSLSIQFDEKLKARRGISIALRFRNHRFPLQEVPAAVISDHYYVTKAQISHLIQEDGSISINEIHHISSLKNMIDVYRLIPIKNLKHDDIGYIYPTAEWSTGAVNGVQNDLIESSTPTTSIYKYSNTSNLTGQNQIQFEYLLAGGVTIKDGEYRAALNIGAFAGKVPIDTIIIHIEPQQAVVVSPPVIDGYKRTVISAEKNMYQYIRESFLSGPLYSEISLTNVNSDKFEYPKSVLYEDYFMDHVDIQVRIREDGMLSVDQGVSVLSKVSNPDLTFSINNFIDNRAFPYRVPKSNILKSKQHIALKYNDNVSSFQLYEYKEGAEFNLTDNIASDKFSTTFASSAVIADGRLTIPIFELESKSIGSMDVELFNDKDEVIFSESIASLADEHNTEIIESSRGRYIAITLNKDKIDALGGLARRPGYFKENMPLFLSILLCLLFYGLWYRYGRDEKYDGSMQSAPPSFMTPAEAGYLWDGKLHGRDLISLIYHWAARGHLSIEEVDKGKNKKDYILEKLVDLPADALTYEKTLFNKIFTIGESRRSISSLRNTFYKTMTKAKKELVKEFESRHLYEPFTRGVGVLFVVLGAVLFAVGLFVLGINYSEGNFAWALPILITSMAMVFFGYYLPKKTALGSSFFIGLQRFEKFIEEAPPQEIASMYDKDSAYFQNTLAFAIVLGKAKEWSKRFEGIVTAPPNYYKGDHYDTFSPILFSDSVIGGMRHMERDFYSVPAPAASSSSYSGGRSSSFGGGGSFSGGGGFGGGGGSSW